MLKMLRKRLVLYKWGYMGGIVDMFQSQYEKRMNGPLLEVNAEDVKEEVSIILVGLYGVINSGRLG